MTRSACRVGSTGRERAPSRLRRSRNSGRCWPWCLTCRLGPAGWLAARRGRRTTRRGLASRRVRRTARPVRADANRAETTDRKNSRRVTSIVVSTPEGRLGCRRFLRVAIFWPRRTHAGGWAWYFSVVTVEGSGLTASRSAGRILVIDDDPMIADVVRRYLVREGFEVEVCGNGRDGLERALVTLPDLVVLDVMLPVLHGIGGFRRLRRV